MKITIHAASFRAASAAVAGKDETRTHLQYICVDLDAKPSPMVVGTDGIAMVEAPIAADGLDFDQPEDKEPRTGKVLIKLSRKLPKPPKFGDFGDFAVINTTERQVYSSRYSMGASYTPFRTPVLITLGSASLVAMYPPWERGSAFRERKFKSVVDAASYPEIGFNPGILAKITGEAVVRFQLPETPGDAIRVIPFGRGHEYRVTLMPAHLPKS